MKTFPAVVTGIFILLALGSVVVFATYTSLNKNSIGTVVVWGSLPDATVSTLLSALAANNSDYSSVTYQMIPEAQLVPQLVEAIASGTGPDLVILPEAELVSQGGKIQPISYSALSKRDFQSTYLQASEVFLSDAGIEGIPFTADPLIMYWNRTLFSNAGIANPPRYWDDVAADAPKLTTAEKNGTLSTSAVPFGTWQNVSHAKEIFLTLLNQLGDPVVVPNTTGVGGGFRSVFASSNGSPTLPADSALLFYSDFSDPAKPAYSWNSAQPDSADAFTAGTLAIYFGFASELPQIRAANPNLNFDIAPVPSIRGGGQGTYAALTVLSIPRGAQNPTGALALAEALSGQPIQQLLAQKLSMPSVRRDVPPTDAGNPYTGVFWNAALSAFAFPDPDPGATASIFERMVENVSSGKLQVSEAVLGADQELKALLGVQ